jgi:hypothetical protein
MTMPMNNPDTIMISRLCTPTTYTCWIMSGIFFNLGTANRAPHSIKEALPIALNLDNVFAPKLINQFTI